MIIGEMVVIEIGQSLENRTAEINKKTTQFIIISK